MKKTLLWILIIISLAVILLRFSDKIAEIFLGIKQISGITITSNPTEATVFLNDKEVGQTPFEDKNLDAGDYSIRIEKDKAVWRGRVKLISGTVTLVDRDIATDSASSAGEVLNLDKGKGLIVVSNPTGADIEIDGKAYGKTPTTVNIDTGSHNILVSHSGYLNRSIKADVLDNFNLTVAVDLALSEADLTSIATALTPVVTQTPEVVVKNTVSPNPGFLRVRDKPSAAGKEIAQVKPGEVLILLEEQGAWDKVRLSSGIEGFVSAAYVVKKQP